MAAGTSRLENGDLLPRHTAAPQTCKYQTGIIIPKLGSSLEHAAVSHHTPPRSSLFWGVQEAVREVLDG